MFEFVLCSSTDFGGGAMAAGKDYAGELQAMGAIMEALAPLDRVSQLSVMRWVLDKLEFDAGEIADQTEAAVTEEETVAPSRTRVGNINTVVNRIGADSCRTILIAAAIYLTMYQSKESFGRAEWVAVAKSAKVWKSDYINQASTMIGRLADAGLIVEKSRDLYFLPDSTIEQYSSQLS
jgi:hypothetical protein